MAQLGVKLMHQQIKTILASLAQRDIRKVMERYQEITGDKIQKNCTEISYKCFEASAALRSKKANGFGRNESEATTNAIKNLLELLLEDEKSVSVIRECIKKSIRMGYSDNQSVSTEEDKENVVKIQLDMSKFQRRSMGSKISQPLSQNNNYVNTSINEERSKSRLKNPYLDNAGSNRSIQVALSALKITQPCITLQKTQSNIEKTPSALSQEEELKKARAHIAQLQLKLKQILDENTLLKLQLQKNQAPYRQSRKETVCTVPTYMTQKTRSTSVQGPKVHNQNSSMIAESSVNLNSSLMEDKKKGKVPRLRLEALPNYHGKSNKCINQALLAVYQEKHGAKKS